MPAYPSAALPAGCGRPRRTSPARGRPPPPPLLHTQRRHAPPRDHMRASSHPRDDASTSASKPPLSRSAAAEPPTTRAARLRNLPVPATHRESKRDTTNDRRRRPAGSRTPRAVRIGEVTCGGGAAAGKARAWLSRVHLQETASARIFRQCKAADRRRWHATGGQRGQERAALQWSKQCKIAPCEAKRQRRRAAH